MSWKTMILPQRIPKKRMIDDVEKLAEETIGAHEISAPPVDVFEIARRERIKLCPVDGSVGKFWGRLEYHHKVKRFLLFYPDSPGLALTRVRFSIGHELGHFFIPRHREALIEGKIHNSEPGFICEKPMEREADSFAAALLMPGRTIESRLRRNRVMTLEKLLQFADDCKASRESAAIRYAKFTGEPCVIVLSQRGLVRYSVSSDEALFAKCKVSKGAEVPPNAISRDSISTSSVLQRGHESKLWFPQAYRDVEVWEESIALGYDDLVLSIVSWESSDE